MAGDPSRDKDFSFARLCDLRDNHVVLKMYSNIELRLSFADE
jgi:hypothetical protein